MPLKPKLRGEIWQAVGRVHYNGRPITGYLRISTGSSSEAGAREWIAAFEERERRRYLLGDEAERLTFGAAVLQFKAKPVDAGYLRKVLTARPDVAAMSLDKLTGRFLKDLGLEIYPKASTDTVWRQVVSPMRAVVNYMHELGKGPPLRVKAFSEKERIDRDLARGKQSRQPRRASGLAWIEAFCAHADPWNAAMARFMFETGARVDQAISLTPRDLDLQNCKVRIKAQKGHPEQWIDISHAMMVELANLRPKQPLNRRTGKLMPPRVFGYASRGGYRKRWATICAAAGIAPLRAHEAGRHGFATELMINRGVDPVTVAKFGRWKSPQLVLSTYGHAGQSEGKIRELFRTKPAQAKLDEAANG